MSGRSDRRIKARPVLLLAAALTACASTAWAATPVWIAHGGTDEVCRAVAGVSSRISRDDFLSGTWRERFGRTEWQHGTYASIGANDRRFENAFRYVPVDVDNDGIRDVAVVNTGTIRSVDFDYLYVFTPKEFDDARDEGSIARRLHETPTLNPRNEVRFAGGVSAVPVELQLWQHKGVRYLLLKEHYFAKQRTGVPDSLFVAKLSPASRVWDDELKVNRLEPELKCRLVAR
jgi:hypothetical protein